MSDYGHPNQHKSIPRSACSARKMFADIVGVTEAPIAGGINRGYLPVVEIGKYRLVNLDFLNKNAMNQEFFLYFLLSRSAVKILLTDAYMLGRAKNWECLL